MEEDFGRSEQFQELVAKLAREDNRLTISNSITSHFFGAG